MSIPKTEQRNPESMGLYQMNTLEMTRLVIRANEDAVRAALDASESIARAIDAVAIAFENGSHLIYVGAGTSGRLGILDAAECPPTFGTRPEQACTIRTSPDLILLLRSRISA